MNKAYKRKTKLERQQWWSLLTPKQQDRYLKKAMLSKVKKRRQRSINIMNRLNKTNDCKLCIHGVTKSCTSDLPRGCEYFYKVA